MRRRKRSYFRPRRSYTWQSVSILNPESLSVPSNTVYKGYLGTVKPGVGAMGSERAFDAPHVLERIRGTCLHEASTTASNPGLAIVQMAALRVPSEFANSMEDETSQDDILDITNNLSGDDYLWYESGYCGADADVDTVMPVNNKSRRKFDVGDVLAFLYRIDNPSPGAASMTLGINLRLLWKLGN